MKKLIQKLPVLILKTILGFFIVTISAVILLKWINPVTSSIMIQRTINSAIKLEYKPVAYEWVDYDDISKQMAVAVVAAEDQNFPYHFGFDLKEIEKALKQNSVRKRVRGASTITQQVAKNLFLWEQKSFIRKGFEAYFTLLIELLWSKERILEVYLNIVEMGDMVFGVGAASQIYFKRPAEKLTRNQAALLTAVLPNPKRFSVIHPSGYIFRRQSWILNQMNSLGGTSYLKNL